MIDGGPAPAAPKTSTTLADLGPRLASGVLMIAMALTSLAVGGWPFIIFWLIAGLAVNWEWQRMTGGAREPARFLLGSLVLIAVALLVGNAKRDEAVLVLLFGTIVLAAVASTGSRLWNAAGLLYSGALVLSVALLRLSKIDGFESILWLFAIVWGTDIMAYFGGRLIGGAKLWPRVSPSKTWSGFLVGISSGALLGLVAVSFYAVKVDAIPLVLIGVFVGAVAQGGDLFESSVKRRFGFKDSSHLIPGHGGFMDRLDGFIAAVTFVAVFGAAKAGAATAAHGLFIW
ncbi:MAG: phosphatidate cytidylyltransferase [Hyphomicrobiales bacterium]|nr:phosphatidate cytidylyltransferase [Hyphomicrobiales bacterium]